MKLGRIKSVYELITNTPRMYIGHDWNTEGLHALLASILELAVDPRTRNNTSFLKVVVDSGASKCGVISIEDRGRGLSTDLVSYESGEKNPAIENVLRWYMPHKPDTAYHKDYGFLDYRGTVLCAVTQCLRIRTIYNQKIHKYLCSRGEIIKSVHLDLKEEEKGTRIVFSPDPEIFVDVAISTEIVLVNMYKLATRFPKITFTLQDRQTGTNIVFNS